MSPSRTMGAAVTTLRRLRRTCHAREDVKVSRATNCPVDGDESATLRRATDGTKLAVDVQSGFVRHEGEGPSAGATRAYLICAETLR